MKTEKKKIILKMLSVILVCGYAFVGQTTYLEAANGPYASNPDPADGAEIPGLPYPDPPAWPTHICTMLIFNPGSTAVKHTGYFSDDYSKVYSRHQDANLGSPPYPYPLWDNIFFVGIPDVPPAVDTLVRDTTYYWTVDETDGNNVVWQGPVWSFYVQSYSATNPDPPNEAINIDPDVLLSWQGGYDVGIHDVYLGTSWDEVNDVDEFDLTFQGRTIEPSWPCSNLAFNTTYYWRVDEVHGIMFEGPIYKGDVWCFTTKLPPIYVDVDAAGANNGSSWEDAYKYLQDALIEADSALKPVEIRVAEGIYKPDQSSADPNGSGDRYATFQLINGVAIYGGFPIGGGVWETRDPNSYETIFSGDLNGDDLPHSPYNTDENSYHVVTGSGTDVTAILDGFTIAGGRAYADSQNTNGGGMYNSGGSPTLANCTFSNNGANDGGGIYNKDSNSTLTNCRFTRNRARTYGGAMFNEDSNPVVTGCTFVGNSAFLSFGGAVYNKNCSPTFNGCAFSDNLAENGGGGMYNHYSSPILTNCAFEGNWSGLYGGGLDSVGLSSCPTVIGCSFIGNSADRRGGGTSNGTSSLTLINCIFIDNSAADGGGGMYSCTGRNINVSNCTFYGNEAPNGNLLALSCGQSNIQFTNCIMWDGGNEIWNESGSTIIITYSDAQGGWPGEGNIDTDPCFADANNGDYHLKSQAGRWDVNSESWVKDDVTSPCIDAGNPGCPLGDEPNDPNNVRINLGAYGGTAEASKSPAYWRSIADMTNDWIVDSNDLKILVDYWLQTGECIPSDLDRSGSVDFNDFAIFGRQ